MKIPIPDDWSGDWSCIQIEWPDSVIWRAILLGMIDQMSAGRLWDERSGSIHAIQAIGREIWRRNIELTPCSGDEPFPAPTPEQIFIYGGGEDDSEECDDMGCGICYRYNAAGVMEILVCGEWVPVLQGDATIPAIETPTGDIGDPETPQPGDAADVDIDVKCRAAYALAQAMWKVHSRIMDHVDDVLGVLDIGNTVAAELPEYTLTKYHLSLAAASLVAASATADLDLIFTSEEEYVSDMANWLKKFMPTRYSLTRVQYEALGVGLLAYSFHEGIQVNLGQLVEGDYWRQIWWALGPGTVNDIMAQSRTLAAEEFDCHERAVDLTPPQTTVLFNTYSELLTTLPSGQDGDMVAALADSRTRLNLTWDGTTSEGSTDNTTTFGIDTEVPLTSITLRFTGNPPTEEWDEVGPFPVWTNIQRGAFDGLAPNFVTENAGAGYVDFKYEWTTPRHLSRWGYYDDHSARYPGRYAPDPFSLEWSVKIQAFETE